MADLSDESDVNPSEMARMVEDLDDLDNTLLGGSSKRPDPFRDVNKDKETTGPKKRVAFKDFDHDDPLADLLSDDETSYEIKKPQAGNTKSNLVADLFGIKNQRPVEKITESMKAYTPPDVKKIEGTRDKVIPEEHSPLPISTKSPTPISAQERSLAQNVREKSQANEEIPSRTEDPQKLPSAKARKSSLMEDLFGTRAPSAASKEVEARPNFSKSNVPNTLNVTSLEPPKPEPSTKSASGYIMDSGNNREPRRGRKHPPIISDPLGLFSAPKDIEPIVQPAVDDKAKLDSRTDNKLPQDLPEWLGGTAKAKETKLQNERQAFHSENSSEDPIGKSSMEIFTSTKESHTNEPRMDLTWPKNQDSTTFYPDVSAQMMSTQFDQQATLIAMQQQEHELKTAATLSHQNEAVAKIVENQKAKLDEQGKMFNALIKHQLDRQSMLESQMKMQQARIDRYIQTLMSQPTSLPIRAFAEEKSAKETDKEEEKSPRPENLVNKLELEKVHLENTVEMLREKHENEITILQESYEKQMLFLRHGKEKLEKKMYEDYEVLENECAKRIEKLKIEKEEMERTYREEIDRLKKKEKIFVEEMHARHSHNVELLQKEHAETIDEISHAKEMERQAVDTIHNHKTDLGDLLQRSQLIIESFQNFRKNLEERNDEFGETRETYLRKQEEHLQLLRDQLNMQQETLVDERKRLLEISQRLDASTAELTAEFKKNSLTINESQERLATRERILIREKQLFDEQMKWEHEHLQAIKEAWTKEQERQMKFIFNEREAVASERAKLEVFSKLKSSSEDMAKVELEIALKTAQEAANEATIEKHKWEEKCRILDADKRSLREKEKHLINRAQELENLTQSALKKRDEGLEALKEAKRTEQRHKEHLLQLQIQLESLAHRENKRATEKVANARERLATRIYPAEKPEKDMAEHVSSIRYVNEKSLASISHASTHFKDVVDPHLLLLKLNLDNKLDTTDELLSAMQVISQ